MDPVRLLTITMVMEVSLVSRSFFLLLASFFEWLATAPAIVPKSLTRCDYARQ